MDTRKLLTVIAATLIAFSMAGCAAPGRTPTGAPAPTPLPPASTTGPAAASSAAPAGKLSVIYDDDGSRDGLAALLYLLGDPGLSVEAVNISFGEAHPQTYVQHVGRVLDQLGIGGIPLGAGQDAPLAAGTPFPDWLRQLSDNFWNYPLPNAGKTYPIQEAARLMVSTINAAPEPVTIFLSGTFTNLAQALRLDPGIKDKIAAVYFMGGAVYAPGNITNLIPNSRNKVAEWNIHADPQAAREVFESGLDLYMVPLDATGKVLLRQQDIQPWHKGDAKAGLAADLYDIMFKEYGFTEVDIFDLTAAVIMAGPELCAFQPLHLDVITDEGDTLGQTLVVPGGDPNVRVCLEPDAGRIKQALDARFSAPPDSAEDPSIDPLVGTWTGTAVNNGFEMQVTVTIDETCQLGAVCGRFDIPSAACSGTLTWVGMEGELYQFQAGDKTQACGEGSDYLQPQPDGTALYISRGDYGETKGSLQREP